MNDIIVVGEERSVRRLCNGVFCVFHIFEVQISSELETLVEGYLGA